MRLEISIIFHVSFLLNSVYGQELKFATDCLTPNNVHGVCVEIQDCKKLYDQVVQNNIATFPFIRASKCGPPKENIKKPKVCCGPDTNYINEKSCMTPNRETALCIPIRSCKIFYDYIRESGRDQERNDYMVASKCGADRNGPLVCCGSDIKFKTTLPDRSECGLQDSLRVLGGEDTDIGEFPWMALLQQTRETGTKIWGCGGSLISHKYVLTAAHCVVSSKSKVTLVRVGEWNLDTSEDCVGKGTYKSCSLPPQDIAVEATTPHPDYVKNNNAVVNDIALIRLAKPVVFNKYVLPICLPLPEERSAAGERSYVSGWGAVSESKSSSAKKQKLKVPIVDLNVCIDKYGKAGYRITTKMICAGGEKGKDSCKGDSGGPLITNTTSANEQFYVEGIVSFGARCGTEGFPAIYTKVTDFLDWIKENVKP